MPLTRPSCQVRSNRKAANHASVSPESVVCAMTLPWRLDAEFDENHRIAADWLKSPTRRRRFRARCARRADAPNGKAAVRGIGLRARD